MALWQRLLGAGMLERARATSLALLGATAAVGLAIAAIAANQGWPLIEGSSIPAAPRQHVGSASVVARAVPGPSTQSGGARQSHGGGGHRSGGGTGTQRQTVVAPPSGGEEAVSLTVSNEAPARTPHDSSPKGPPTHGKSPATHSPAEAPQPPAPSSPSPAQAPVAAPPSPPAPTMPEATSSEAPPEESNVPSWSNGRGHAYGRSEAWHDHGEGDGEG